MSRYIDVKEVLNILCDNCKNVKAVCPHYPCEQYTKIEGISTADVVEVVRCKDCKHADKYHHCDKVSWWNNEDDFCSRGERREDGEI